MNRYYHVMKKHGEWHLYAGNAVSALMVDLHRANIIKAARTLARHNRAKVILHRDESEGSERRVPVLEQHLPNSELRRIERSEAPGMDMVGGTGFEPVTPAV